MIRLLIFVFTILTPTLSMAQDLEEVGIGDARFFVSADTVFIYYDLTIPEGESANVKVELRRGSDSSFSFVPRSLFGATCGPARN